MNERQVIGFLLPAVYAVGNPFNGIREQAMAQADALAALGHEVIRLDPWQKYALDDFDVLQYFTGGPFMHNIHGRLGSLRATSVFAPIIDTLTPNWQYRLLERLGRLHPRLFTTQRTYRLQADTSDVVIARSDYERRKLVDGLGVDPDKVHIVLNGCPAPGPTDPALAREALGIDGDFLLHVSRYTNTTKNVENLIRAVIPTGWPLIIAGTEVPGPTLQRIRAAAEGHPQIRFVGRVDDAVRDSLYAACRVFCLPSLREGTGLVAVEAAARGARVVITANGGPPDYFGDRVDYVNDTSADAVREAIENAWQRDDGDRLQRHVLDHLLWQHSAESLLAAYATVR